MTATEREKAGLALGRVQAAREKALQPDGLITPSMETDVQNALLVLKRSGCRGDVVQRVERIAATLFLMARAKANGRPNLYNSQRLRLRQI
jgi:hypothetical protein